MKNYLSFLSFAVLVMVTVLAGPSSAMAADGGQASGKFESKDISMQVTGAYAFLGASSLGGKEKVIVVAVSNRGFVQAAMDEYWDRKNALERYFKDENTGLVYFEFTLDGRYRGLSYYFGSGNGCGYCADPAVVSTIRLKDNRMSGKLSFPKGTDPNRSFDISLDVPVSGDDHGKAQGSGGGEPGKAYLNYHRTISGKDQKVIKSLLSEERRSTWEKAEAKGSGDSFVSFLRDEHPKEVRVTEAYVKGDAALLLLEGQGELGKVRGEAKLVREKGSWRFEEETFSATP